MTKMNCPIIKEVEQIARLFRLAGEKNFRQANPNKRFVNAYHKAITKESIVTLPSPNVESKQKRVNKGIENLEGWIVAEESIEGRENCIRLI
ncbi:hypothetical protein [Legionella rowbothamii]|uniref:hypothetical protein n=1 Tax=Legionella rowbothamii TaxID=96229 RepID=UPI0013EF65CB|nr:hypothetical protein [Legionella rowbothamii]